MLKEFITKLVVKIFCARWIVSTSGEDDGEMGFRICGCNFWYYKWTEPHVDNRAFRDARKREFGEVVRSKMAHVEMSSFDKYVSQDFGSFVK